MVTKNFLSHSLSTVYENALLSDANSDALVEEIRRLAVDASIFTPEEIEKNQRILQDVEFTVRVNHLHCYLDGAIRPSSTTTSSKTASCAFIVQHDDETVMDQAVSLPDMCYGQPINIHAAEYQAFIKCLNALSVYHPYPNKLSLTLYSDSENMVNQINLRSRTRSSLLRRLLADAQKEIRKFKSVTLCHIPRKENKEADALAGQLIDDIQDTV